MGRSQQEGEGSGQQQQCASESIIHRVQKGTHKVVTPVADEERRRRRSQGLFLGADPSQYYTTFHNISLASASGLGPESCVAAQCANSEAPESGPRLLGGRAIDPAASRWGGPRRGRRKQRVQTIGQLPERRLHGASLGLTSTHLSSHPGESACWRLIRSAENLPCSVFVPTPSDPKLRENNLRRANFPFSLLSYSSGPRTSRASWLLWPDFGVRLAVALINY